LLGWSAHAVRRGMARTVAFYRDRMAWYSVTTSQCSTLGRPRRHPVVDLAAMPRRSSRRCRRPWRWLVGAVPLRPELTAFEEEFAAFHGPPVLRRRRVGHRTRCAYRSCHGRSAPRQVLDAAFTVPTAAAVGAARPTPVFVDVERATGAIDAVAARPR